MKKIIIAALSVCAALTVQAQGTVTFENVGAGGLNCPVKLNSGTALATGTTYTFQLFAGTSAGSLTSVATTTTMIGNGYFNGGTVTVNSLTAGGPGVFQVDVWLTSDGSFAGAQTAGASTANQWGQSGVFSLASTGNPTTSPPGTPAVLLGMGSAITLNAVPEPTTIAFAGMGLGAFLIARRRKA